MKNKETIEWDKPHGLRVEFRIDGRIQLNGDGGLLTYLEGSTLVNPHLKLRYKLVENDWVSKSTASADVVSRDSCTRLLPHPHTMKLGEFMTHAGILRKSGIRQVFENGFFARSRCNFERASLKTACRKLC